MPAHWTYYEKAPASSGAFSDSGDGPLAQLVLTPNRSLTKSGLAWLLVILWALLLIPLIPLIGTFALWVMLPFLLSALLALWYFIERNNRDGQLTETVLFTGDRLTVARINPRAAPQNWEANPYWVSVHLKPEGGPVDNYLTLKGNGREIELGAFLAPEERLDLRRDLEDMLRRAKQPHSA